jgi:hypothetical protein
VSKWEIITGDALAVLDIADTARRRLSQAFENSLDLQPTCNQLATNLRLENG